MHEEVSETIETTPIIAPYIIDDVKADVNIAIKSQDDEAVASRKRIVGLAKLVDDVDA